MPPAWKTQRAHSELLSFLHSHHLEGLVLCSLTKCEQISDMLMLQFIEKCFQVNGKELFPVGQFAHAKELGEIHVMLTSDAAYSLIRLRPVDCSAHITHGKEVVTPLVESRRKKLGLMEWQNSALASITQLTTLRMMLLKFSVLFEMVRTTTPLLPLTISTLYTSLHSPLTIAHLSSTCCSDVGSSCGQKRHLRLGFQEAL